MQVQASLERLLERQDLSCTYLARHDLENFIIITTIIIIIFIVFIYIITYNTVVVVTIIAGDSGSTFNSAQILTRRNMVVMYGNERQLFQPDKLANFVQHMCPIIIIIIGVISIILLAGDSWNTFNSAQMLTRRNMVVMYGNKRQLFHPNKLANFVQHMYPSVFFVQVGFHSLISSAAHCCALKVALCNHAPGHVHTLPFVILSYYHYRHAGYTISMLPYCHTLHW